jgi:hypothetical protein
MVWFGARAALAGRNPYELIGPGREFDYTWKLLYPMPALVAVVPLSILREQLAATVFVTVSAGLLAFGMTRDNLRLLPMLVTEAFVSSCRLGQWSLIVTASLFFPLLGVLTAVKPQSTIPILVSSRWKKSWVAAIVGSVLLLTLSFVVQPHWIDSWMHNVQTSSSMKPPVARFGGFLILLVLIRWRRPESWLIATFACLPQSVGWYGTLPLLTVPGSLVESLILAGTSALGVYFGGYFMPDSKSLNDAFDWAGGVIVLTVYLPAVIMVLRRTNESVPPVWLERVLRKNKKINAGE